MKTAPRQLVRIASAEQCRALAPDQPVHQACVAMISGDSLLFLSTAIGGTILGRVTAIAAVTTYLALDSRGCGLPIR